jgi:hypothetical protein
MLSVATALLLSACTTVEIVQVNKKKNFSLADYQTYDFQVLRLDIGEESEYSERIYWIRDELVKHLENSGLKRSEENPDLLINVGLVVEEKIQTRETDFRTDAVYMGTRNYSWQSEEIEIGRYKEGTFTIDFVDTNDNTLKCMGVAQGVVVKKDEESKNNIARGAEKLFKQINKESK